MSSRIKVEINSGNPVWLSPIVEGEILKMLHNFSITISKTAISDEKKLKGPGDVPCVILKDFSKIVSKSDFSSSTLAYSDDLNWSYDWREDDLRFNYHNEKPFGNNLSEYKFVWRDFYTAVSPGVDKKINISVEAHSISDCDEGSQGAFAVQFAYPAYITSFKPEMDKTKGIVMSDSQNDCYIVSKCSPFEFKWTGVADFTDAVILRKNGTKLKGSFFINGSYHLDSVVENVSYELTVSNSYHFSDVRALTVIKTNWHNKCSEKGIFLNNIYDNSSYNSQIFIDNDTYYVYCHPSLYRRDESGEWMSIATNNLYNADYSCFAAHLYNGKLYVAGNIKGCGYFSFCHYDLQSQKWEADKGMVRLPVFGSPTPICCGFAFSENNAYFYHVKDDCIYANIREATQGWGGGNLYINALSNMKIIGGTMIFYIDRFYMAILCKKKDNDAKKCIFLYACIDEPETYLMRLMVSDKSNRVTLLGTDNNLWIATDNEMINCDTKIIDQTFYPPACADHRAWLGSSEEEIVGIFPDKNLWIYKE